MKRTDWFLTVGERGNEATTVDRRHPGTAWSEGNRVTALTHPLVEEHLTAGHIARVI